MSLGHLNEIDLEFLVELFPKGEVLVFRVSKELKGLANSEESVPFQDLKKDFLIFKLMTVQDQTFDLTLLLHENL